jgi:hypothetical protein
MPERIDFGQSGTSLENGWRRPRTTTPRAGWKNMALAPLGVIL